MSRRLALITGGRRGIGLGIALCLAKEGLDIAICGQSAEADDALAELKKNKTKAEYFRCDVGNRDDRESLLQRVRSSFGRLDVLVNNAGVAPEPRIDILDASEESYDRVMDINLKGAYFLTQSAARWMIEQKERDPGCRGCIINVSSISATTASVRRGDYCLSKAGLSMSTKLWAVRLAEYGINVYEIQPGLIRTDMTESVRDKYDKMIEEGLIPAGRWGKPEDVGRIAAMMARGDAAYSTGQVIAVDGGMTIDRI